MKGPKTHIMLTMARGKHGSVQVAQAPHLRLLTDSTPGLIRTSLPDGYLDFFSERDLDRFLPIGELSPSKFFLNIWDSAAYSARGDCQFHPDDRSFCALNG